MMSDEVAAAVMTPIAPPIRLDTTAAAALRRMRVDDLEFLAVVSPDRGKLLGVVLRGALERACEANGHDPESCPLGQHLKTDIDFCFVQEAASKGLETTDEPSHADDGFRARKLRVRRYLPVIVVDGQKVPVGLLLR